MLTEMALLTSKDLTTAKKLPLPPVGLDLVQEINAGLRVQCLINCYGFDDCEDGVENATLVPVATLLLTPVVRLIRKIFRKAFRKSLLTQA